MGVGQVHYGTVVRSRWLSPHMVRIVLGGEGLAGWQANEFTDAYLVLWFPADAADYTAPFDVEQIKATYPRELWPRHRHYTARHWDPEARELTIDFVVHGDQGVAGPWARAAVPGDRVVLTLPHGAFRPDVEADHHLLVGDESAFPAIAAAIEQVPAHATVTAVLVCDGPDNQIELACPATLETIWLHRRGEPADAQLLVEAVRALPWPQGRVQAFVKGEAGEVREVRRHLLADRGMAKQDLSASGYWRRTMTDEAWRQVKRDFVAQMEQDVVAA